MKYIILNYKIKLFINGFIVLSVLILNSKSVKATTFTVDKTNDYTGASNISGTLRYAIIQLNNEPANSTNRIEFAIPGSGPHIITLLSPLDVIRRQVVIDGTTQAPSKDYAIEDPVIIIESTPDNGTILSSAFDFAKVVKGYVPLNGDASNSVIKAIMIRNIAFPITILSDISSGIISPNPPPISNVIVENCVFYDDIAYVNSSNRSAITFNEAINCTVKGCYFGTNHSFIDNKGKAIGISIGLAEWANKYIIIGGVGRSQNIFYSVDYGLFFENNANNDQTKYNYITKNKFLKFAKQIGYTKTNYAIYLQAYSHQNTNNVVWPNESIQKPVISDLDDINGNINGTSGANYKIEVYKSNGPETAIEYIGFTTADATGSWSFKTPYKLNKSMTFTATATNASNSTSQLSNPSNCQEPVVRSELNCNAYPTLYIPNIYTNIAWKKGTNTVGTSNKLDLNTGTGLGAGTYTVTVSNTGGTCSYTSAAIVIP